MKNFYTLNVKETNSLIGGKAKSVLFDIPTQLRDVFSWKSGQHITLRFKINGQEFRRSYSVSSSPVSGDYLRITVKRVTDGVISNHINDNIKVGDTIDVMPPFGGFVLDPGKTTRRTHYFLAAGSGITPLFSMLHTVMCAEPYSVAYLAYGNKAEESIIFKDELEQLSYKFGQRLKILHILSESSMWSTLKIWRSGILDKTAIEELITKHPPYAQDVQYYICGPGNMNKTVKSALMNLDVPVNRIHMESYGGTVDIDNSVSGIAAQAEIILEGKSKSIKIDQNQTILDAAINTGLTPPYSCQSGICGACQAQLNKGSVHMRARMALEDTQIEKGLILTCQSIATSAQLSLTYDQ